MNNENTTTVTEMEVTDNTTSGTSDVREASKGVDRTGFKYSSEAFKNLPREKQRQLFDTYLLHTPSKDFDADQMFQFSRSKLSSLLDELGFEEGIIDRHPNDSAATPETIIYIDHGRRENTVEKKLTLSEETAKGIEKLFAGLSNIEKSKAIDAVFSETIRNLLAKKEHGTFHVEYRPCEKERLI